jgi:hypothetical protein
MRAVIIHYLSLAQLHSLEDTEFTDNSFFYSSSNHISVLSVISVVKNKCSLIWPYPVSIVNYLRHSGLRIVLMITVVFTPFSAFAQLILSSEYRYDVFDGEETGNSFFREKVKIDMGKNCQGSLAVVEIPAESRRSYTWYLLAANYSRSVAIIAGNFATSFGSGILTGRMNPYNPDPFKKEPEPDSLKVFTPSDSGYPAYYYNGAALSIFPNSESEKHMNLHFFCSLAQRYYSDIGNKNSESSPGSVLSHIRKEYPFNEPVCLRTAGGMASYNVFDYFTAQFSSLYFDMTGSDGGNVLWSAIDSRRSGYESITGFSAYLAYNDGVIKSFIDWGSVRSIHYTDGKRHSDPSPAFQGEASVTTETFGLKLFGKRIGSGYYSPYFSTVGKRTPSEGLFIDSRISPYEFFTLNFDSSVDKSTDVSSWSPEPLPTCREGVSLRIKADKGITLFTGWRGIGESISDFPERIQSKSGAEFIFFRVLTLDGVYTAQKKERVISHSAAFDLSFRFLEYNTIELGYTQIWIRKQDDLYISTLALDDARSPWLSVRQSSRIAGARYKFHSERFSLGVRYLTQFIGKRSFFNRFECSGYGEW